MTERVKTTAYFDGYKLGKSQKFFMVIAALTYAFELMDMSLFGIVAPIFTEQYGLSNEKIATLNFLFFIGSFLGSVFGGWLSDKIGRKKAVLINIVIFSVASFANAMWQPHHLIMLEASRFFTGFGTMAACTVSIAYISEMLPSEKRGKYQSITLGIGTFSIPFIAVLAATVATASAESWRIIFLIGSVMILLVPFAIFMLVESPRWLISKGKVAEAEAIMEKCLGFPCDMSGAYENYKRQTAAYQKISFSNQMKIMFGKDQLKQTIVCVIFAYCLGCGNNMMSSYNNVFLTQMGFAMGIVMLAGAISSFGQPVGELLSSLFSDKGGRTVPIMVCCGGAAIMCFAMGFIQNVWAYAVLQFIKTLFTASAMALLMTYIPESFPTSVRASAVGYIYGTQKIVIAVVSSILPVMMFTMFGWFGAMGVNGLFWLAAALVIGLFGKKTALTNIDCQVPGDCEAE